MRPSFIYHQIHAILEILAIMLIIFTMIKNYKSFTLYEYIMLLLVVSITFGIHAVVHFWEEVYFDFNPLIGRSTIHDIVQNVR